jgi:Flp pilus assembly protein TadB
MAGEVVLTEWENSALAEIEKDLCASDPELTCCFTSLWPHGTATTPRAAELTRPQLLDGTEAGGEPSSSPRVRHVLLAVLGALLLVICIALLLAPILFLVCVWSLTVCSLAAWVVQRVAPLDG